MTIALEPLADVVPVSIQHSYLITLQNVQKTLCLTTSMSLAIIDADGNSLVHFTHPYDKIHPVIMKDHELLAQLVKSASDQSFQLLNCIGGLMFMANPIVIDGSLFGYILVGPVWESPPNAEQCKELNDRFNWSNQEIMQAVMVHPAPVPLDLTRGRELAVSLAELTTHIIDIQQQQNKTISTMRSLYKISTSISSSLDLKEVLPTVLNSAIDLLNAASGSINLVDRNKTMLQIVYKESAQSEIEFINHIPLKIELSQWLARESKAQIHDSEEGWSIRVPLLVKDNCIGSLKLGPRKNGIPYVDHDLQVLGIVAGHASSAIDKAQVYSTALRQYRELEALQEVGHSLNSSTDVPQTLHQVLDHACELLEAQTASLMLIEDDKTHLKIRVARGLSDEVIAKTRVKLGERISGKVALHGIPIHLSKGYGDKGEELEASLCVPLKVNDTIIGVLNVRGHSGSEEFTTDDLNLASRLASMSAAAIENASLHDRLQSMFVESITALANSIDARDPYTRGHSERVAEYSVLMARKLKFSQEEQWQLRSAALLHDIGKIKIRDNILNKPDKLNNEEYEEMQRHPVYGAGIMMPVKSFRPFLPYILHHHEWYNGNGYPDRKQGDEIPLCARIICVADSFDAMTSDRPYRRGMDIEVAIKILRKDSGTQFDPYLADLFIKLHEEGQIQPIIDKMRAHAQNAFGKGKDVISSPNGGYSVIWKVQDQGFSPVEEGQSQTYFPKDAPPADKNH